MAAGGGESGRAAKLGDTGGDRIPGTNIHNFAYVVNLDSDALWALVDTSLNRRDAVTRHGGCQSVAHTLFGGGGNRLKVFATTMPMVLFDDVDGGNGGNAGHQGTSNEGHEQDDEGGESQPPTGAASEALLDWETVLDMGHDSSDAPLLDAAMLQAPRREVKAEELLMRQTAKTGTDGAALSLAPSCGAVCDCNWLADRCVEAITESHHRQGRRRGEEKKGGQTLCVLGEGGTAVVGCSCAEYVESDFCSVSYSL